MITEIDHRDQTRLLPRPERNGGVTATLDGSAVGPPDQEEA